MIGTLHFVLPGDPDTPTGGYIYDKRIVAELGRSGWTIERHLLGAGFPNPSREETAAAEALLTAMPDGAVAILDGLCLGVLPDVVQRHGHRLRLIGLVHHPLAEETGLTDRRRRSLVAGQHHVTAQQLAGIARQRSLEPGRKETHRAERCHRQHHRDHQQPQFAGAKVAPALAPGQGEDGDRQCVGVHEQDGTPTARRLGPPCRCDLNAACSGFEPAAAQPLL